MCLTRPRPRKRLSRRYRNAPGLAGELDGIAFDVHLAALRLRRLAASELLPDCLALAEVVHTAAWSISDAAGRARRGPDPDPPPDKPVAEADRGGRTRGTIPIPHFESEEEGVAALRMVDVEDLCLAPDTSFALSRNDVMTVGELMIRVDGVSALDVSLYLGLSPESASTLLEELAAFRTWFLAGCPRPDDDQVPGRAVPGVPPDRGMRAG